MEYANVYKTFYEHGLCSRLQNPSPTVWIAFQVFVIELTVMNIWGMNLEAISHMFTFESILGQFRSHPRPPFPVCVFSSYCSPTTFSLFSFSAVSLLCSSRLSFRTLTFHYMFRVKLWALFHSAMSHFPNYLVGEEPSWELLPQLHLRRLWKFNRAIVALYQVKTKSDNKISQFHNTVSFWCFNDYSDGYGVGEIVQEKLATTWLICINFSCGQEKWISKTDLTMLLGALFSNDRNEKNLRLHFTLQFLIVFKQTVLVGGIFFSP